MPVARNATRAQLGAANEPAAHVAGAPAPGFDEHADEFPAADTPIVRSPGEIMRWRARPAIGPAPGPATDAGNEYGVNAAAHSTRGEPDQRRVWGAPAAAGYPEPKQEIYRPSPETAANVRTPVVEAPQAPPVRHRGGHTSDDPARPPALALATFVRPFDQWSAQNFIALDKIEAAPPRAAVPYTTASDVAAREPSPGGGLAIPGIGPSLSSQPNTFRILPRPWDELLITTGQTGAGLPGSADTGRRAVGWRARG